MIKSSQSAYNNCLLVSQNLGIFTFNFGLPFHPPFTEKIEVLTKTRNDLKRPTTSKKQPETAYNDLQPASNDLKQSTTSNKQRTMTWTYLQQAKKRRQTTNNKQILRLFYNMEQTVLFSNKFSTQHLVAVIQALLHRESWWKQSVKHLLSCVKRQLSCFFLRDIRFIFFCLGFVSAGEGRSYYFSSSLLLPPASQIVGSSAFAFIREV